MNELEPATPGHPFSRRTFLAGIAVAGLGMVKVPRVLGAAAAATRSLSFHHLHTGEDLTVAYRSGRDYLPDALQDVNQVLRDWRTGQAHPIDPELLDLLHDLHGASGSRQPFQVICGYRAPATNRMLASRSPNVSPKSLHLKGKAIDIRLGDVSLAKLRMAAADLRRGGVGYYPASNFVHVDTGRVRAW